MTVETIGNLTEAEIVSFSILLDERIGTDYEINSFGKCDFGIEEYGITVFDIEDEEELDILIDIEIAITSEDRRSYYYKET